MIMNHLEIFHIAFIGVFAKFQKVTIYFTMSVCLSLCPSVRMEQRCSHWMYFHEILYWSTFKKNLSRKCFIKFGEEYLAQCF
jgi:hypothetical protein